jgi:hypothetical protein
VKADVTVHFMSLGDGLQMERMRESGVRLHSVSSRSILSQGFNANRSCLETRLAHHSLMLDAKDF